MTRLLPLACLALLAVATVQAQSPPPPANPTAYQVQRVIPSSGSRPRTSSQMDERKFITIGMSRATVLQKIGEPDSRIVMEITYIASQTKVDEPYIDTYEPVSGDAQTRTRIRYVADAVVSVERDIVR